MVIKLLTLTKKIIFFEKIFKIYEKTNNYNLAFSTIRHFFQNKIQKKEVLCTPIY